ncbi:MAG: glycosyltransferase [Candidatus Bathyarchaeia archaeon]
MKIAGRKTVITLHNIRPHERIYLFLEHIWFKLALKLADGVIVHNHYSYNILTSVYGISKKVYVIPHGNFIDYYPNTMTPKEARRRLRIPDSSFVLLFFGALRDYKGIDDLIMVLRNILPKYNALFAVFVGGIQSEKLRRDLLKFSKEFKGRCIVKMEHTPDEEVQVYMNAADIGILPYKEVTTSGAVLLFQSFGKTVIVPDLPSIKEVLGDSGIYYKQGDMEEMEAAIIKSLILGKKQVRLLGRKAYERALKMDWNYIAHLTSKFYKKLLGYRDENFKTIQID